MARAWLADDRPRRSRTDYPGPGGWKVVLDGDRRCVDGPLSWNLDGPDGRPQLTEDLWALGHVVVKVRALSELDDAGNPVWDWAEVYDGPSVSSDLLRREVDDVAGSVTLTAAVVIPYPVDDPSVAETAVVLGSNGVLWNVTSSMRANDQYRFEIVAVEATNSEQNIDVVGVDGGNAQAAGPDSVDGGASDSVPTLIVDGGMAA